MKLKSKYPIGAVWEGKERAAYHHITGKTYSDERTAKIWLESRENNFELWKWITHYPSGKVDEFGWVQTTNPVKHRYHLVAG